MVGVSNIDILQTKFSLTPLLPERGMLDLTLLPERSMLLGKDMLDLSLLLIHTCWGVDVFFM